MNFFQNKVLFLVVILFAFTTAAFADVSVSDVISKIRDNQSKIKDFSAKVTTTLKSDNNKKAMRQTGLIFIKDKQKNRMEMLEPMKQITIVDKDKMMVLNPDTGKKTIQDLKKLRKQTGQSDLGQNPLDQTKMLDYLNLSIEEKGIIKKSFIITGIPKDKKMPAGKIKFYVDGNDFIPQKIELYNAEDKLLTSSELTYTKIENILVITNTSSWILVPNGKIFVEMKFEDIKVNKGLSDQLFEIK